ncbi:MAG: hypothetical protein QOG72_2108 [Sphingomonadales bacterium]|jgi:serine protease Do|nr:hypothetical protein [Sphingomonadales bacterium]
MILDRRSVLGGLAAFPLLHSTALRAAAGPIVSKIALDGNRIWVAVTIAGRAPELFIVDTGAVVSLIQPSYARKFGLKALGPVRLRGVGGVQQFLLHKGSDVVLGGAVRQASAVFAVPERDLDLPPEAAGLIAAGMLTSVDTELDFEAGEWRIYPDGRGTRAGFEALPSRIRGGERGGSDYIYVDAVLDGRSYRLLADTGMPGQVLLAGRATRGSGLWNDKRPYAPVRSGGIGGAAERGRLVRASRLSLGSIDLGAPLVSLAPPGGSAPFLADGIIGLELIERLTLSTDVRGNRLWARRNGRAPRPERYGLSGLWVEEKGDRLVVADLSPLSPASEAGLKVGDEILGVSLGQWIAQVARSPGAVVPVSYRRGGEPLHTRLTLRAFL